MPPLTFTSGIPSSLEYLERTKQVSWGFRGIKKTTQSGKTSHRSQPMQQSEEFSARLQIGKLLYRDACNAKLTLDAELPDEMSRKLMNWEENLLTSATTKRSLAAYREPIQDIELHAFGVASRKGVAATVYAVVTQPSEVSQGLVIAKAKLAKQGLTIPRLELVSGIWQLT